ncbi:DUF2322 family protein [Sphaerotilus sp.]|uniref:DUF2322 family protein n=1 Tax=Sphaerotilus sp. TaxID=2093942 RepID=UPI002ACDFFA4|nr:DUF2322 family protein [Sphaerotilus sp.]MDZ7858628.1 DUF2322 family protein [Sphaerotilus sp.]
MNFSETLKTLPGIQHLAGLQLLDSAGVVVATLDNRPGQAGSVAVYHALAARHGMVDAAAAQDGLALYAEHTADARAFPGKHPNIDRLLAIAAGTLGPLQVRPLPQESPHP